MVCTSSLRRYWRSVRPKKISMHSLILKEPDWVARALQLQFNPISTKVVLDKNRREISFITLVLPSYDPLDIGSAEAVEISPVSVSYVKR